MREEAIFLKWRKNQTEKERMRDDKNRRRMKREHETQVHVCREHTGLSFSL